MRKRVLGLSSEGRLVLKSADGRVLSRHVSSSPTEVALILLDCSGSMTGSKLSQAVEGARDFVRSALSKGYSVGVIRFSTEASLICPPQNALDPICRALGDLSATGSTNMTAAIRLAYDHCSSLEGYRAVVLVTDGQPNNQNTTLAAAQEIAARGVHVMAIGTDDADLDFLSRLSTPGDLATKVDSFQLRGSIAAAARMLPAGNKR